MKTVVALYDDIEDAREAVDELVEAGIPRNDVSLVARDVTGEYGTYIDTYGDDVGEAAASGAVGGAVVGGLMGLLVGLGAFAIPGLGPVIAAGPLAATLAGAGIGAATGGLLGALVEWGIPEAEAEYYAEGVRRGGTLLAARVPDTQVDDAIEIMNDYDPVNVERRAEYWRDTDAWEGYDVDADPYTVDQVNTFRSRWEDEDDDFDLEDVDDVDVDLDLDDGDLVDVHVDRDRPVHVRSYFVAGAAYDDDWDADLPDWEDLEDTFRRDYDANYSTRGYSYDQYSPAYRYGYNLATDRHYANAEWDDIEDDVRTRWEEHNEGTWDDFADAIEYGWEQVKDALGAGDFNAGVEDSEDEWAHDHRMND